MCRPYGAFGHLPFDFPPLARRATIFRPYGAFYLSCFLAWCMWGIFWDTQGLLSLGFGGLALGFCVRGFLGI